MNKEIENSTNDLRNQLEQRLVELEAIKNQYIGAIEAYKDVLNTIMEKKDDAEDKDVSMIKKSK